MYKYDPKSKVLKIQQIAEDDIDVALAGYQLRSYKRFCTQTVFDRLYEFIGILSKVVKHTITIVPPTTTTNPEDVKRGSVLQENLMPYGFYIGTRPRSEYTRELRAMPDRYTPIMANLSIDGARHNNIEVFRLPEMDADGILNIAGERRVCNLRLTAADGLSFDGSTLGLSIPMRNISIAVGPNDIKVKTTKGNQSLTDIVCMYCEREGFDKRLDDLYCSAYVRSILAKTSGANYAAIDSKLSGLRLYEDYHVPAYHIGKTARASLNRALSLDRAFGRVLSRTALDYDGNPIPGLEAGKVISSDMIKLAKRSLCNVLYVKAVPDVIGYHVYQESGCFCINHIPAGTIIPESVRKYLPKPYCDLPAATKDIYLRADAEEDFTYNNMVILKQDPIIISTKEPLTYDVLQLLYALGYDRLRVCRTSNQWFDVTFEEEIIGNYSINIGEYYDGVLPEGWQNDDWVCFYHNKELKPTYDEEDYLTVADWIGILGLCSYIHRHPNDHGLLNKDSGMLKRILGPNELFDRAFEHVFNTIPIGAKRKWMNAANNAGNSIMPIDLRILFQMWRKELWDSNVIAAASFQNPVIHSQQVNLIDSAAGLKEVPNVMRMLSTGYYGRIDPYETPSGKRLGITNTCALGAQIDDDGVIRTRYVRVSHDNPDAPSESWLHPNARRGTVLLDAQEETRYRIGDKLSLSFDPNNPEHFYNTKVVARVPDGHGGHTIETVDASTLDLVNYHSLQHLSCTSCLVPFVGADESARMTLATGMLKQSILVQYNEKPRMYTQMYRQIFSGSPTYCQRARRDGIVTDVTATDIVVHYPPADYRYPFGTKLNGRQVHDLRLECASWDYDSYSVRATTITRQSVNIINYHVKNGDWVRAGDLLYDSSVAKDGIYSPGCNFLVAYIPDGYNYEDAVEMSESAASKFTSISLETQAITLPFKSDYAPGYTPHSGEYIWENQPIADFAIQQDGRTIHYEATSGMHSGILLEIIHDPQELRHYSRYLAYFIAFNKLHTGDKLIGRHSNKGTASIVRKNSEMPRFMNGVPCDVVLNPMGVPSRLNIGQNYEAYLGFIAHLLDIYIESDSFNGATKGDIRELMHYVYDLANSQSPEGVNSKYPHLPSELRKRGVDRHSYIRQWAGCFNPDGTAYLINPASGKPYATPVTFGMPYMLKLEHEVNRKIKARAGSLEEDYTAIYQQPVEGAARGGGERVGEMEFTAYAAYGANALTRETMNEDSDNMIERLYSAKEDLRIPGDIRPRNPSSVFDRSTAVPHSVEHLRYLLEALGISMDADFLPDVSQDTASRRVIPDKRGISRNSTNDDTMKRMQDAFDLFSGGED